MPHTRPVKIRNADLPDAATVTEFNILLARESEGLELNPETVKAGVNALLGDSSKGFYFLAEDGGKILGQLMITFEWSDWRNGNIWWIQSVYVREDSRGRGVFKGLLEHVERLAKETGGICSLRLYMDKHNDKARRAYARHGLGETEYVVFDKALTDGAGGHD